MNLNVTAPLNNEHQRSHRVVAVLMAVTTLVMLAALAKHPVADQRDSVQASLDRKSVV